MENVCNMQTSYWWANKWKNRSARVFRSDKILLHTHGKCGLALWQRVSECWTCRLFAHHRFSSHPPQSTPYTFNNCPKFHIRSVAFLSFFLHEWLICASNRNAIEQEGSKKAHKSCLFDEHYVNSDIFTHSTAAKLF